MNSGPSGNLMCSPQYRRMLRAAVRSLGCKKRVSRQAEVIALSAIGLTDPQIAGHLGCAETTVKTYWRRLFVVYQASTRTGVVATVLDQELIHFRRKAQQRKALREREAR